MRTDLREHDLMQGVLALVVGLSEMIKDALKLQSLQQMQERGMSGEEVERWKRALMDLDAVLDRIRSHDGLTLALRQLGRNFDHRVDDILSQALNPDSFKSNVGTPRLPDPQQED